MPKIAKAPKESSEREFLDAAEQLFSEHGYEGAKVRAMADAAGANLGALHYYWGSKKGLFRAVCERRLRPLVEERQRRFDECLVNSNNGVPDLRQVLTAGIEPLLTESVKGPATFGALMARTLSDPSEEVREVMRDLYEDSVFRYVRLLRQACPHLDSQTFFRRLHIVLGGPQHANSARDRMVTFSRGDYDPLALTEITEELVEMLSLVLLAPMRDTAGSAKKVRKARSSA